MEIISVLVVFSILGCVIFIGVATIRLILAEDQAGRRGKVKKVFDSPSNDLLFTEIARPRSTVARIRPMKVKS